MHREISPFQVSKSDLSKLGHFALFYPVLSESDCSILLHHIQHIEEFLPNPSKKSRLFAEHLASALVEIVAWQKQILPDDVIALATRAADKVQQSLRDADKIKKYGQPQRAQPITPENTINAQEELVVLLKAVCENECMERFASFVEDCIHDKDKPLHGLLYQAIDFHFSVQKELQTIRTHPTSSQTQQSTHLSSMDYLLEKLTTVCGTMSADPHNIDLFLEQKLFKEIRQSTATIKSWFTRADKQQLLACISIHEALEYFERAIYSRILNDVAERFNEASRANSEHDLGGVALRIKIAAKAIEHSTPLNTYEALVSALDKTPELLNGTFRFRMEPLFLRAKKILKRSKDFFEVDPVLE